MDKNGEAVGILRDNSLRVVISSKALQWGASPI
jgi:hypothetical protein